MKRFTFTVRGFEPHDYFAETRSKARYKCWLEFSEAYPCTFGEFQKICT